MTRKPFIWMTFLMAIFLNIGCSISNMSLDHGDKHKNSPVDVYHGIEVIDPFRWLEDRGSKRVAAWEETQINQTRKYLDSISSRDWIVKESSEMLFYDDATYPREVLDGKRIFWWTKSKEDEHWMYWTRKEENTPAILVLDPNIWPSGEQLNFVEPCNDGRYVAYGKSSGGDENTQISILDLESGKLISERLSGWQQERLSWFPDNSGFFYSAKPLQGEVPEGEEHYWHRVYSHKLGSNENDQLVFKHDSIKEKYHQAVVTEDGAYVIFYRFGNNKTDIYFRPFGDNGPPIPIVEEREGKTFVFPLGSRLLIQTDHDAPNGKVMITDMDHTGHEFWRTLIPEQDDNLEYINPVDGLIYAVYLKDVHTVVKIFDFDGTHLGDVPLPGLGTANVSGYWSKPPVLISYSSYNTPAMLYNFSPGTRSLEVVHKSPISIDSSEIKVNQIFYDTKDSVRVPMFIISSSNIKNPGKTPTLLYGYGGFSAVLKPHFNNYYYMWVKKGGIVAIANIRGGGEYGRKWHEAAKTIHRQIAFDDFIAAAEYLISEGFTDGDHLSIMGGSNGGLLVAAVAVQRPDLFQAVCSDSPLLDMIRFNKFGIANLWTDEYGDPEDPQEFLALLAYSPYHNVVPGTDYPACLFVARENDARVDPLHARKMVARLQEADGDSEPILFLKELNSGHLGATTLSGNIQTSADIYAFLMDQTGL